MKFSIYLNGRVFVMAVLNLSSHSKFTVCSYKRTYVSMGDLVVQVSVCSFVRVLTSIPKRSLQSLNFYSWFYITDYFITPLQKHAYWNILKILPPKMKKIQIKKPWYFSYFDSKHRLWEFVRTASSRRVLTSTHNLCFRWNKKNNMYPCKPQFYYIKVGFEGVNII